jgi:WD40 repeat protein
VVDLFKVKASNPWLDRPPKLTDSHLVVYDTARLEPIFVLWPPPGPITYRGSYALSPDGKLLAVLHDNRIMLYQLMDQVAQHGKPAAH